MIPRASGAYAAHQQDNELNEALRVHAPLVRRIAYQISSRLPPNVMIDDLVQEGMAGLLDALRRYQPQPNLSFEAYARTRIRGAIYDACRRNDILPRHQRDRLSGIEKVTRALEQRLGRPPEEAEIAAEAGMSLEEYFDILSSDVGMSSLDSMTEGLEPVDDAADPMQIISFRQQADKLAAMLKKLPEKEALVLALHYQEELSYREIAYVMNLTAGRISQLHSQAMVRLRSTTQPD